jgi:hypothetical protein
MVPKRRVDERAGRLGACLSPPLTWRQRALARTHVHHPSDVNAGRIASRRGWMETGKMKLRIGGPGPTTSRAREVSTPIPSRVDTTMRGPLPLTKRARHGVAQLYPRRAGPTSPPSPCKTRSLGNDDDDSSSSSTPLHMYTTPR